MIKWLYMIPELFTQFVGGGFGFSVFAELEEVLLGGGFVPVCDGIRGLIAVYFGAYVDDGGEYFFVMAFV